MKYIWLMLLAMISIAQARYKPEYAQLPQATRDWYESRTLTPEAEVRLHFHSCCAHSDVVQTKFRVNKTSGADEWYWLQNGKWKRIPPDIIHWDEHSPNGEPTLFVVPGSNEPSCFYPGDGGI